MPKFGEDLNNVTVPVGREAIFICNVEGLATYKVLFTYNINLQTIIYSSVLAKLTESLKELLLHSRNVI